MNDDCSFRASLIFHAMFQEDISCRSYPDVVTISCTRLCTTTFNPPPLQTNIIRQDKKDNKTQYDAICEISRDM